jgi:hypothetical protein
MGLTQNVIFLYSDQAVDYDRRIGFRFLEGTVTPCCLYRRVETTSGAQLVPSQKAAGNFSPGVKRLWGQA